MLTDESLARHRELHEHLAVFLADLRAYKAALRWSGGFPVSTDEREQQWKRLHQQFDLLRREFRELQTKTG